MDVIIPPNTTASVTLPGETTLCEVGAGAWHWSIPYVDPDARGPFTVDDLVGEIMSDSAARDTMMAELDRAGAPGFLKMILFNEGSAPLRVALHMLPNYKEAVTAMNQALLNLSISKGIKS
jgi:alpha-L-rhamnosidase